MSASYIHGLLINVPDGNELSFDDGASAFFDFDAYSLAMTTVNTLSGLFEPYLDFAPTPALVGVHLQVGPDGWYPAMPLEHPAACLIAQRHDVATNTASYLVQTAYGWSKTVYGGMSPGEFVYATLAGYAASGDHRSIVGIAADDGVVLLDVFSTLDHVRGIPASTLTNPDAAPLGGRDELGNAFVTLLYDGVNAYGFGAPVFEPAGVTYRIPITIPLTKKPVVKISMGSMAGTGKYVSIVDITTDHIRYAFFDAASDIRVQNTSGYSIKALGTTYTEL